MRKSVTGVALPAIRTHQKTTSTYNKQRIGSVFVERVKQQIGEENQYQSMANSKLTEEQRKLKQLLRQFNDQTHSILSNFIDSQPRVTQTKSFRDSAVDIKVREKEGVNKNKIIEQCEYELKQLQSRCQNLKYINRQEMEKQIQQTKQQIESLRVQNKDLSRNITLNGLNICKGERLTQIKDLQYQKLQLQIKKSQLIHSSEEIIKESEAMKEKTTASDQEMLKLDIQYKVALTSETESANLQKLKQMIKQKKKMIQGSKIKNEQIGLNYKQRYLNKLRQLDQTTTQSKKSSQQLVKKEQALEKSRRQLIILQHQYSALKKNGTTIKLLVSLANHDSK